MSELKQLLNTFDKLLMKDVQEGSADMISSLKIRNIVLSTPETYPKWRSVLLGNYKSGSLGSISSKTEGLIKAIIKVKEMKAKEEVSDDEFEEPIKSPIEWSEHPSFRGVGRCFICGRELTNPQSVADGIGPVCIKKYGGFNPLSSEKRALAGWVQHKSKDFRIGKSLSDTRKGIRVRYNGNTNWMPVKAIVEYKNAVFVASWFYYKFKDLFSIKAFM